MSDDVSDLLDAALNLAPFSESSLSRHDSVWLCSLIDGLLPTAMLKTSAVMKYTQSMALRTTSMLSSCSSSSTPSTLSTALATAKLLEHLTVSYDVRKHLLVAHGLKMIELADIISAWKLTDIAFVDSCASLLRLSTYRFSEYNNENISLELVSRLLNAFNNSHGGTEWELSTCANVLVTLAHLCIGCNAARQHVSVMSGDVRQICRTLTSCMARGGGAAVGAIGVMAALVRDDDALCSKIISPRVFALLFAMVNDDHEWGRESAECLIYLAVPLSSYTWLDRDFQALLVRFDSCEVDKEDVTDSFIVRTREVWKALILRLAQCPNLTETVMKALSNVSSPSFSIAQCMATHALNLQQRVLTAEAALQNQEVVLEKLSELQCQHQAALQQGELFASDLTSSQEEVLRLKSCLNATAAKLNERKLEARTYMRDITILSQSLKVVESQLNETTQRNSDMERELGNCRRSICELRDQLAIANQQDAELRTKLELSSQAESFAKQRETALCAEVERISHAEATAFAALTRERQTVAAVRAFLTPAVIERTGR